MACCSSCASGGPCSEPKLGGTRMAFPARADLVFVKGGVKGSGRLGEAKTGSSFWDAFSAGYEPGQFTKSLQAGAFSSSDVSRGMNSYGARGGIDYPMPQMNKLEAPRVDLSALQSRNAPLQAATSINPASFAIEIPSIYAGSGGMTGGAAAGGIGKVLVLGGILAAVVVGFKKFRARKTPAAA